MPAFLGMTNPPPLPGSGKFRMPWERMHSANLSGASLPPAPADDVVVAPDPARLRGESPPALTCGIVVEATVATPGRSDGPLPHAERARTTATSAVTSRRLRRARASDGDRRAPARRPGLLLMCGRSGCRSTERLLEDNR